MSLTIMPLASQRIVTRAALAVALALTGVLAATSAAAQQPGPAASAARRPAGAEERATVERADPLSRSVFWANEQQINSADPIAGVRLAAALRDMGQYDRAVEAAQQTLIVQPRNVEAMLELGRAQIGRGQAFHGVAALEQARAMAPEDWRPLSLLGVAYQQIRRHDEARAAWSEGLRLSPDNPAILANVGMALMAAGDPAGAETLLRRACAQPGATLKIRQDLALVLGLQGKMGEAEAIIRRDLPPEQADRNLAWLRAQTGGAAASARTWQSLGG